MRNLQTALIRRGIPDETALKHVTNLRRTFTAEDLEEIDAIQSPEEIDSLADSIASILKKRQPPVQQQPKAEPQPTPRQPASGRAEYTFDDDLGESFPEPAPVRKTKSSRKVEEDPYFEYSSEAEPTTRGMLIFWIGLLLTLPIWLGLLAVMFVVFIALFVALSALIVVGVAAIIAIVTVGAGIALVGIVFGITQLFTFPAGGLYEIGLGVMIAGAVLFVAVLLYNFSIRLLPWLITQLSVLLKFLCRKLKELFLHIRRECYKL
ncbi:MAG: hypothetical protein IK132_15215 [Clostridia bacterium]|nr:hypothetical protein [Clostridia bacterium]